MRFFYVLVAAVCLSLIVPAGLRGFQVKRRPGSEPFHPSKLQWLSLELTARWPNSISQGYHITFDAEHNSDAIVILVHHLNTVDREVMNKHIESAKGTVTTLAKKRGGWDTWVKIKEDIRPFPGQ